MDATKQRKGEKMKSMQKYESHELISDGGGGVVCKCGNVSSEYGFYPCDNSGEKVEPTKADWKEPLYVCDGCKSIIHFSE